MPVSGFRLFGRTENQESAVRTQLSPERPKQTGGAAPSRTARRRSQSSMEALKAPASFSGEPGPGGPRSLPPARPATGFFPPHPHDPLPTGEPEPTAAHRDAATLPEAPSLGPCRVSLRGSGQGSPVNPSRISIRSASSPHFEAIASSRVGCITSSFLPVM